MFRKKYFCLSITLLILVISGCEQSIRSEKIHSPISVSLTPIPISTDKNTPSPADLEVKSTQTFPIPLKTQASLPVRSTVTSSSTPIPTLSRQEQEKVINRLLTEDYQCKLPCFGGIVPGITSWNITKPMMENISGNISSPNNYDIYFVSLDQNGKKSLIGFYVLNDRVEFLLAPRFDYPVSKLFSDYGEPDEILLNILEVLPNDTSVPYTIFFYYKKGLVARYEGQSIKSSQVSICLNQVKPENNDVYFMLWDGKTKNSFKEVFQDYQGKFASADMSFGYFNLEELGKFTTQSIFETYKKQDERRCFKLKNPYFSP
jgi:hypothetical protein